MYNSDKPVLYKEQILALLKKMIIARNILPGDILNERKLAGEFDVSRTPVRDAIQVLEQESWVKVVPWKGAVVQPVTIEDVKETFQLRIAIEPMAIELAMPHITQSDIDFIEHLAQQQKDFYDQKNSEQFIDTDQSIHLYIAKISNNKRLYQILKQFQDIHKRIGVEAVQKEDRNIETLKEHAKIINAIKAGDVVNAKEAMREHLTISSEVMYNNLKDIQRRNEI